MKLEEIKFRAWHKFHKQMYEVLALDFEHGIINAKSTSGTTHTFGFIDIILLQYTGLKDKNGKEIYEGDLIKKCFGSSTPIFSGAWDRNRAMFIQADGYNLPLCDINPNYLEIVGNIYSNPELLTPDAP